MGDSRSVRKPGTTVKQQVYELLKEKIIRGFYGRGQQLRQEALAVDFGVSRIPVREALLQLEKEGLVQFFPYKGAVVASLSPEEVREIFEIRYILESAALGFAVDAMTDRDYEKVEAILAEAESSMDPDRWVSMNWEFHSCLYGFSGRPRLVKMIDNLHQSIDRYIRIYLRVMKFQSSSTLAHREMLHACREGNIETAKELLKTHQARAMERIVAFLSEQ